MTFSRRLLVHLGGFPNDIAVSKMALPARYNDGKGVARLTAIAVMVHKLLRSRWLSSLEMALVRGRLAGGFYPEPPHTALSVLRWASQRLWRVEVREVLTIVDDGFWEKAHREGSRRESDSGAVEGVSK